MFLLRLLEIVPVDEGSGVLLLNYLDFFTNNLFWFSGTVLVTHNTCM